MDHRQIERVADQHHLSNRQAKKLIRAKRKGRTQSTLPQRGVPVANTGKKAVGGGEK
jgi:K+-transporting ATPase c subunit